MGKKSGPPAPPPPPDYAPQRQQDVEEENKRREEIAKGYNQAIDFYNKQLSGYGGTLGEYADQVFGLALGDDLSGLADIEAALRPLDQNLLGFTNKDVSFLDQYQQIGEEQFKQDMGAFMDKYYDQVADAYYASVSPNLQTELSKEEFLASPFAKKMIEQSFYGPKATSGFLEQVTDEKAPNIADYGGSYAIGGFGPSAGYYPTFNNVEIGATGLPVNPGFQPAGTSYGAAVAYDMPTLNELNFGLADSYMKQIDDIQAAIDALQQQEQAELSRIDDFFGGAVNRYDESDIDIKYADINEDFNKYLEQIERERQQLGAFESVLGFDDQKQKALDELLELEGLITGRQAEKDAEQLRIDQLLTGIPDDPTTPDIDESTLGVKGNLSAVRDALADMGIADLDEDTYDRLLAQLTGSEGALQDFTSDLMTDFSREYGQLYGLEDELNALLNQRQMEEARVDAFGRDFTNRADQLDRLIGRQDQYSLSEINELQDLIGLLENEIGGFQSELPSDFTSQLEQLTGAQTSLSDLITQRDQELGDIQSAVDLLLSGVADDPETEENEFIAGLADLEEFDEAGMFELRDRITNELNKLGRYEGGLGEYRDNISAAIEQVDARLRDLGGLRGDIETDALAKLQDIRNREYFSMEDVETAQEEIEALRQRMETYGATQAADELQALADVMSRETGRLSADAMAVAEREAKGRAEIESLLDPEGNLRFPTLSDGSPIQTEEQLMAYLAGLDEDDELFNLVNPSAFSQNLLGQGA
jgi:hypothetical protein